MELKDAIISALFGCKLDPAKESANARGYQAPATGALVKSRVTPLEPAYPNNPAVEKLAQQASTTTGTLD